MESIGLKMIEPGRVPDAFKRAGVIPLYIFVRLMVSKFFNVNSSSKRWSFLENVRSKDQAAVPSTGLPTSGYKPKSSMKDKDFSQHSSISMNEIRTKVITIVNEVLGSGEIDDAGEIRPGTFDSLSAVELSSRLMNDLNTKLPSTLLFDYPSIDSISSLIFGKMNNPKEASPLMISKKHEKERNVEAQMLMGVSMKTRSSISTSGILSATDSINRTPWDRWDVEKCLGFGGWMKNIDLFDEAVFNISPNESLLMDPQQRILLEVCYELLSSYSFSKWTKYGVYIGMQQMEYRILSELYHVPLSTYSATSSAFSVCAGRIAFTYGFQGPAVSIDTACSSALVAAHSASHYVRERHEIAISGSINLMLTHQTTLAAQTAGMLAMDGRCKTLDANANGYGRSEACTAMCIEPLKSTSGRNSTAFILLSTFINQDGRSSSLTAPNGPSQQRAILGGLDHANLCPENLHGLEMHGTGTPLGDPIEIGAITTVLCSVRRIERNRLKLGAAKSRYGHAEPAAGGIGVLNASAMLMHKVGLPIVHLNKLNYHIQSIYDELLSHKNQVPISLRQSSGIVGEFTLTAGVSSFAFQGTNAFLSMCSKDAVEYDLPSNTLFCWRRNHYWFGKCFSQLIDRHILIPFHDRRITSFELSSVQKPRLAYLLDHVVKGRPLFPASAMIESCNSVLCGSLKATIKDAGVCVIAMSITSPYLMVTSNYIPLKCVVDLSNGFVSLESYKFSVPSKHMSAIGRHLELIKTTKTVSLGERIMSSITTKLAHVLRAVIQKINMKTYEDDGSLRPTSLVTAPPIQSFVQTSGYHCHPAMLDSMTHINATMATEEPLANRDAYIPVSVASFHLGKTFLDKVKSEFEFASSIKHTSKDSISSNLFTNESNNIFPSLWGFTIKSLNRTICEEMHEIGGELPKSSFRLSKYSSNDIDKHCKKNDKINLIQKQVQDLISEITNQDMDITQPFMEAGLDSLGSLELRANLIKSFSIDLPATVTMDYPNIEALSNYISELVPEDAFELHNNGQRFEGDKGFQNLESADLAKKIIPREFVVAEDPYHRENREGNDDIPKNAFRLKREYMEESNCLVGIATRYPIRSSYLSPNHHSWPANFTVAEESVTLIPLERWDIEYCYSPDASKKMSMYVRLGQFLDRIEFFDPAAFKLRTPEAISMDPQQRLLLENTYFALEDALERTKTSIRGTKCGVHVGVMYQEFTQLQFDAGLQINSRVITGNGISYLVGRVAYTFNFSGPNFAIDTACSSSLVAIDQANVDILRGNSDSSVAAGVNAILHPVTTASICTMGALSSVSRCKTFDASADGYGRGEGAAVFVILPKSHCATAIALIKGSSVNQDGRSSGLTAPNGPSQTTLIKDAIFASSAKPESIRYISLHGTGTPLGDPIEVGAYVQALKSAADRVKTITVGSTKSCYGHTEGAAGVTGALLAVASLRENAKLSVMHLRNINPYVVAACKEARKIKMFHETPRNSGSFPEAICFDSLAGSSSFGMSGTNAHVVLSANREVKAPLLKPETAFYRHRCWPTPVQSQLLQMVVVNGRCQMTFMIRNLQPKLTFLLDHKINGHLLLPATLMFEAMMAGGRCISSDVEDNSIGCIHSTISAPASFQKSLDLNVDFCSQTGEVCITNPHRGTSHASAIIRKVNNSFPTCINSLQVGRDRLFPLSLCPNFVITQGFVDLNSGNTSGFCIHPSATDCSLHIGALLVSNSENARIPVGAEIIVHEKEQSLSDTIASALCLIDESMKDPRRAESEHYMSSQAIGKVKVHKLHSKPFNLKAKHESLIMEELVRGRQNGQEKNTETSTSSFMIPYYILEKQANRQAAIMPCVDFCLQKSFAHLRSTNRHRIAKILFQNTLNAQHSAAAVLLAIQCYNTSSTRTELSLDTVGALANHYAIQYNSMKLQNFSGAIALSVLRVAVSENSSFAAESMDISKTSTPHLIGNSMKNGDLSGSSIESSIIFDNLMLPIIVGDNNLDSKYTQIPNHRAGHVVVTGGLGGIGSVVASWLNIMSPENELLLLGRLGVMKNSHISSALIHSGSFTAFGCDVGAAEDVSNITSCGLSGKSIPCIMHASGIVDDKSLLRQSPTSFRVAMSPKLGFINTWQHSGFGQPINQFNIFSSVAVFLGSPGQANYASANMVLDEWSGMNNQIGIFSTTVQWGPWSEVGMANRNTIALRKAASAGLGIIRPSSGLTILSKTLMEYGNKTETKIIASPFNFKQLLQGLEDQPGIFDEVFNNATKSSAFKHKSEASNIQDLERVSSKKSRNIQEKLLVIVENMLDRNVNVDQPLMEAGLDSLGAVELRNEISSVFNMSFPATFIFDQPTITSLGKAIASMEVKGSLKDNSTYIVTESSNGGNHGSVLAVSGLSCRYPGYVRTPEAFLTCVLSEADLTKQISLQRWNIESLYYPHGSQSYQDKTYARFASTLEEICDFDARIFGIKKSEAMLLDPQQRMLLEETYISVMESIENANYVHEKTGVFVGCMYHEYPAFLKQNGIGLTASSATGGSASFMVGRISYNFGFTGPCVCTDTACSSSLVALHLARRCMQRGDSQESLVGGTNILLSSMTMSALCNLQALSPTGRCQTLNEYADGYGRGEGVSTMLLSLINKNDQPHCISFIRSTAINQDGRSSGLTAPSGPSQSSLIEKAYTEESILPRYLAFVALHGTGTPLGDPIEVNALSNALKEDKNLIIGSSKSFYGHTEGCAGMTGLISSICVGNFQIAPQIMHLRAINPFVGSVLEEWKSSISELPSVPRQRFGSSVLQIKVDALQGTSSFGMSGVNAHALSSVSNREEYIKTLSRSKYFHTAALWPVPCISHFLKEVAQAENIQFEVNTIGPATAWAHDYKISGTTRMPSCVVIEICAGALSATRREPHHYLLQKVTLPNTPPIRENRAVVSRCSIDLVTGVVELKHDAISCGRGLVSNFDEMKLVHVKFPKKARQSSWLFGNSPLNLDLPIFARLECSLVRSDSWLTCPQQLQSSIAISMIGNIGLELCACDAFYFEKNNQIRVSSDAVCLQKSNMRFLAEKEGKISTEMVQPTFRIRDIVENHHDLTFKSAWSLDWCPVQVGHSKNEFATQIICISTQTCRLHDIVKPDSDTASSCILSIRYNKKLERLQRDIEVQASSELHLGILLNYTSVTNCAFISKPCTEKDMILTNIEISAFLESYKSLTLLKRPPRLSLVTFSSQYVHPFSYFYQTIAILLHGIARTIFMEYKRLYGPSIDMEISPNPNEQISLEMFSSLLQTASYSIAVRSGRIYSMRLVKSMPVRKRRCEKLENVLVLGGSRGLGLQLSREIAKKCKTLVIASRTGVLESNIESEMSDFGVRIENIVIDSSNYKETVQILSYIRENLPIIDECIFAAGTSGHDTLQDISIPSFWRVAASKVSNN